jgi:hypothetical protein
VESLSLKVKYRQDLLNPPKLPSQTSIEPSPTFIDTKQNLRVQAIDHKKASIIQKPTSK